MNRIPHLILAALVITSCAPEPSGATSPSRNPATPAGTRVARSPDQVLADSYAAMQKVTAAKSNWSREGTLRYVDALNPSPQQEERVSKRGVDLYETSPAHASDKLSVVGDDRLAGERDWTLRMGAALYQRYGTINASGALVSETAWLSKLDRAVTFPGHDFGRFPNENIQGGAPKLSPGKVLFKGEGTRNGVPAYDFTWTGDLSSMGNAAWEGTYADEVWISIDTLLWVRHEENLKYADGLSWDAAEDYSEYNVPPSVTAPPGVALPDQQGLVGFRDVIFDPTPGTLDSENTTSLKIYRDIRPYFYTNSYIGVIAVPTGTTDRTPAQHAAAYFSFERNRQHTGSEPQTWEGWTEGQRVIDGKTYPTMTFRVVFPSRAPKPTPRMDGVILLYFPPDLAQRQRFYLFKLEDVHPEGVRGTGFADLDVLVASARFAPFR